MPATPTTVALYVSELASWGMKPSTLQRRLVAISQLHKRAGYPSPSQDERVKETLKGIKRTVGSMQEGAAPILLGTLKLVLTSLDVEGKPASLRDKAILLFGLAGSFRRSEISSLRVEALRFVEEGVVALLRCSKTDQEDDGHKVALPYGEHLETCPVRNLKRWNEKKVPCSVRSTSTGTSRTGAHGASRHQNGQEVYPSRRARSGAVFRTLLEGGVRDRSVGGRDAGRQDNGPD